MTAFRQWTREKSLYSDPPQDEVYTKIEHLTSTLDTASACFAAYGFPSAHERSWKSTIEQLEIDWRQYAPSSDAVGEEAAKCRASMGRRLRKTILGLLGEKATAYNRFRRGTDITAQHEPGFRSATSPGLVHVAQIHCGADCNAVFGDRLISGGENCETENENEEAGTAACR